MMRKLPTKSERTWQVILDAAYHLFIEQGYRATSMRQIASRANVSLSGIYNHFESKEQIFNTVAIERHPFLRMLELLRNTPGDTLEAYIPNAARAIMSELRAHPEGLNLVLIGAIEFQGKPAPEVAQVLLPQASALFERFEGARGQLRDLPLQSILLSFFGMMLASYVSTNLINPGGSDLPELEPQLDILLNGIMKPEHP